MNAQYLYTLREVTEFCSGNELHEFFRTQTGDPSPSGYTRINRKEANKFIENCVSEMEHNSPQTGAEVRESLALHHRAK